MRELRNTAERVAVLAEGHVTTELLFPRQPVEAFGPGDTPRETLREYRHRSERAYIVSVLRHCDWNVSAAARLLGIHRGHLHERMTVYSIERPRGGEPA